VIAMRLITIFAISLSLCLTNVHAQSTEYETVLLPITLAQPVPGAFGSLWATDLRVYAQGGNVFFIQFNDCLSCLPTYVVPAGETRALPVGRGATQPLGTMVSVSKDSIDRAIFNLRITDLSRQALTWGTELPVVREKDFRTTAITLINVPTDSRFRQALRVYDLNQEVRVAPARFNVQFFDMDSDSMLAEREYRAVRDIEGPGRIPAWVQLTDLVHEFPQLSDAQHINIVITPIDAGTRFWAFVSITNNEAQSVTTITPQ
jgi:hypothetical protein